MENNADAKALCLTDPAIEHLNRMSNIALVQAMAYDLDNYIQASKGSKKIGDKRYIYFETWQYVAAQFGCTIVGQFFEDLSISGEKISNGKPYVKYRVAVELVHTMTGRVIGRAWGSCSNAEGNGKPGWDEFSLESMAQTRAGGKVCRMVFGHLAQMAGYEATPLEEMQDATGDKGTDTVTGEQQQKAANKFKTPATPEQIAELEALYKQLPANESERVRCEGMLKTSKFMLNNYEYFLRYFNGVIATMQPPSDDDF